MKKNFAIFFKQLFLGMVISVFCIQLNANDLETSNFCGGDGTSGAPYLICTAADLDAVRANLSAHYKLGNNIDLGDYLAPGGDGYAQWGTAGWLPIGTQSTPFIATFDGDGYEITGLWMNRPAANYQALFGYIQNLGSAIKNLGVHIAPDGIAGNQYVAGIAGDVFNTAITNCYATGTVSAVMYGGGIAGRLTSATISQCYAHCDVNASSQMAGGIAADIQNASQITDCYTTGDISGNIIIGGIAGRIQHTSKILRCYALGNITGNALQVGGIVGLSFNTLSQPGNPEISYCYAFNPQLTLPNIATLGRILGANSNSAVLSNNYALDQMYLNTISPPPGIYTGEPDPADRQGGNITACMAVVEGKITPENVYTVWDFPNVWTFNYTNYHVVTVGDKTNLPILSAFTKTSFPSALQIPHLQLNEADCDEEPEFISVTNLIGVPTTAITDIALTLVGTVVPSNATHQSIVWSVKTDGGTGSTISGEILTTTDTGTVTITATIVNGIAIDADYTQDFNIVVINPASDPFTITATAGANGTINPSGTISVSPGADQSFDFTANTGYLIDQVLIDGVNDLAAVANEIYIFTYITTNHTIHVNFKKDDIGIDENKTLKIKIFPNPTHNEIFIKSELPIKKVEIYSMMDVLLFSEYNFKEKISISTLPKGVYILKIYSDNNTAVRKIVKE